MPTKEIIMPIAPAINPFQILFPLTLAMTDNPNSARLKNSAGPKFIVNSAIMGEANKRTNVLNNPPKVEAVKAIIKAFFAFPSRASGYPSNIVAAAALVPGVPIRMALIEPPNSPPQKIPVKKIRAAVGDILYESGRNNIIPIVPVSPGIAPKITPMKTPRFMRKIICTERRDKAP
jgi:hypothetical protein